jgi:hypothetical protein
MQPQFSKSTGRKSRSMKTCGRSRRKATTPLTSSAAASPAKTSASPEKVLGSPVLGPVFGTSSLGSLAQFGPDGWSLKTSQLSLLEGLEPFSETWPKSGLMRNGIAYRLQPLVRRTGESVSGSLPFGTPTANEVICNASPTPRMGERFRRRHGGNLLESVAHHMWPTPSASQMPCEGTVRLARKAWMDGTATLEEANAIAGRDVRDKQGKVPAMWRTPNASLIEPKSTVKKLTGRTPSDPQVGLADQVGGSLNPTWVKWLMGFPLGWTALDASATPSSRKSLKSSGEQSLTESGG